MFDLNSFKFAFSSNTFPIKWWMEHTKEADLAIHECFIGPSDLVNLQKWAVADALNVGTQVHTSPAQFGLLMKTENETGKVLLNTGLVCPSC